MNQQIIAIEEISADNAPTIYVAGGLNQFFEAVKAEVTGEVPDLTTAKGRARIASLAAKVSSSKAAVEKPGRDYLKRLKEMPKAVEGELKVFVDAMNALRDETRKPLTDWEADDVARRDAHEDRIDWLRNRDDDLATLSSEAIEARIAESEAVEIGDHWEEFEAEAARVKEKVLATLRAGLVNRKTYEAEQAELIRLRAESEAQAQRDREAEIARAAVAEAQRAADQAAKEAQVASAKREQALIDKAAKDKYEADLAAHEAEATAERQRLQLELQAEQAERLAAQAKADQLAAERRAEQDRIAAVTRQEMAVEQARLSELARQQAAADEIIRQQKARQADMAHKSKILGEAKQAIMSMNVSEELAKAIVLKIARGEVPNVTVNF